VIFCEILYAVFPNSENSCSISLCGERHSFKLFVLRRPQVSNCLFYDAHSVPDSVPSNGSINVDRRLEGSTRDLAEVFFRHLRGQTEENH